MLPETVDTVRVLSNGFGAENPAGRIAPREESNLPESNCSAGSVAAHT